MRLLGISGGRARPGRAVPISWSGASVESLQLVPFLAFHDGGGRMDTRWASFAFERVANEMRSLAPARNV